MGFHEGSLSVWLFACAPFAVVFVFVFVLFVLFVLVSGDSTCFARSDHGHVLVRFRVCVHVRFPPLASLAPATDVLLFVDVLCSCSFALMFEVSLCT